MCTDIERSPFSPRAGEGQTVALRMGRLEGRHCNFGACVKYNLKALHAVCSAPILRGSLGEKRRSDLSVFVTQRVTVFGYHAISSVWPLVSYLNSMVSFYRCLFRRLWTIVRSARSWSGLYSSPVRCRSTCRWVSGQATCFFSRSAGILHCHLLLTQR